MGKIKLTLSVDEHLVIKAKQIAHSKKQSLSNIFEKLLVDNLFESHQNNLTSKAKSLRGIAKSPLSLKTDKEIKEMMIKEKYGI